MNPGAARGIADAEALETTDVQVLLTILSVASGKAMVMPIWRKTGNVNQPFESLVLAPGRNATALFWNGSVAENPRTTAIRLKSHTGLGVNLLHPLEHRAGRTGES